MPGLRLLLAAPLLALVACASAPPVQVSAHTWSQVDQAIATASREAEDQARQYAVAAMGRWLLLVQRTKTCFAIPWCRPISWAFPAARRWVQCWAS